MYLRKRSVAVLTALTLSVAAVAVTPIQPASAFIAKDCAGALKLSGGFPGTKLTLEHKSKWHTDLWNFLPAEFVKEGAQTVWATASGLFRGCSNTVRYRWPGGTVELSMTYRADGTVSASCTVSGDVRSCTETRRTRAPEFRNILNVDWHVVLP